MQAIKGVIKPFPAARMFLVTGNGRPSAEILKSCTCCLQHEGRLSKVPLHPMVSTAPYGSLTCTLYEYRDDHAATQPTQDCKCPGVRGPFHEECYGICDPEQTTKTAATSLYQGYISIFGAPTRLLSDCDANFMSNIINKMCKLLGMKKLHT